MIMSPNGGTVREKKTSIELVFSLNCADIKNLVNSFSNVDAQSGMGWCLLIFN